MKKITLLIFASFFSIYSIAQDCTSNTEHDTYPALNNGFIEEVTTTIEPGEYMTVSNVLANDYTLTANHSVAMVEQNDYITISNTSNTILAQGGSPLFYTFASSGTYRIHVSLNSNCDTDTFNLTVTLLNETIAPTTCQEPENPTVSYRSDTRIDFSWNPPSVGDIPTSYDWEAVPDGSSQGDGGNPSGNVLTTMASVTGLTPNTDYEFYIRSNCIVNDNGTSNWIGPLPLTTNADPPPNNDICSGATLVIQETDVANAASATEIDGSVINTAQTDVDPENCDSENPDNARDDVWYSFIAQTTDINITLNTSSSSFNGILSLFSDCDESSYLACSDAGNGNTEEEISYNSLVVGQTYYFRVWHQGFATSNPDFTVKLWSPTIVADADGDGYSDPTDCDDGDPNINPSATEVCDGQDNDCDGDTDDADSDVTGQSIWYADTDSDGFGDPSSSVLACNQPGGYVADNTDCNDTESASYPGNTEICDGIDNDCDGLMDDADPSITGQSTWYEDSDGDNYGNPSSSVLACNQPGGYVSNSLDCDDGNSAINPDATEICDGIDNDCANGVDDGLVFLDYYPDSDEDGFGDESAIAENSCSPVSGKVADNTDCDDTMDTVYPGAPEIINDGIDQDCDGSDQTLGIDDFNLNNVLIHPNPFSNKLSIQLPNEFINYKIDIELFDLIGRSIFRLHKTANDSKIVISNMDDLPSGIYLMKISINEFNKSTVKRIIKD